MADQVPFFSPKHLGNLRARIRAFVVDNFLFGDEEGLQDETSFQESGIIDSTGILELVDFLEKQFGIAISDEELIPDNLDSIDKTACFLNKKVGASELSQGVVQLG
ncbi:acyl carrier protein [Desulfuromonas sp. CSMB_57]|jgi:acyl carrier protein|uniref:acyl carrier protein n=1 Tax=Desulfuromonas sp. CSMB_57 TaxID=2807629 RepID=UPI001CD7C265|nr:acyl carrier protein [Desulfuromonas sp. CSMB_57]